MLRVEGWHRAVVACGGPLVHDGRARARQLRALVDASRWAASCWAEPYPQRRGTKPSKARSSPRSRPMRRSTRASCAAFRWAPQPDSRVRARSRARQRRPLACVHDGLHGPASRRFHRNAALTRSVSIRSSRPRQTASNRRSLHALFSAVSVSGPPHGSSQALDQGHHDVMKVRISADIAGVAGVFHPEQTRRLFNGEYGHARAG